MSVIWPHLYQHRPGRKLAVNLSSTEIEIAEISRFLCHRYFSRKMRRSGLPLRSGSLAHVKSFSHRTDEHTTLEICQMIETMEQLYPDIFNSVTTNMHVSSFHERQLCQDFSRFAEALFKNGIKWSLLLAYFAFCGGLAEECMRNGKPRLVTSVMNWSHCFISMHLVVWIEEQGGWAALVEHFQQKCETETGNGRISKLKESTNHLLNQTFNGFKRRLTEGAEMDKDVRTMLIASLFMVSMLYCIVVASRIALGHYIK